MKRTVLITLATIFMVAIILTYNNCGQTDFTKVQGGATIGNPYAPVSNEILLGICGVINRCNSQVSIESCESSILNTPGFSTPLGLTSKYSTFNSIIQGEQSGAITGNTASGANCYQSIDSLSCGDPVVMSAYNPNLSNPYTSAPGMIPTTPCMQSFTPGMSLEVPIELVDQGLSSNSTATAFSRTLTSMDTGNYDGTVAYYFEIVASNTDSIDRNVTLLDSSGTPVASITIPPGTANSTRMRTSFTPTPGANNYRVELDGTSSPSELTVFTGRILVQQIGATKTALYVPLMEKFSGASSGADDSTAAIDDQHNAGYGIDNNDIQALWNNDQSNYSQLIPGSPYKFEAVLSTSAGSAPAFASLFDSATGLQVSASEVTTNSTAPTLVASSFAADAPNFTSGDDFEVLLKTGTPGENAYIYHAGVWIYLNQLTHAEIYYRYTMLDAQGQFSGNDSYYWGTVLFNSALFNAPLQIFHEGTGEISAAGTPCVESIVDVGTTDVTTSQTPGTVVAGSPLSYTSLTNARQRTGPLSIISGHRFISQVQPNQTPNICDVTGRLVVTF